MTNLIYRGVSHTGPAQARTATPNHSLTYRGVGHFGGHTVVAHFQAVSSNLIYRGTRQFLAGKSEGLPRPYTGRPTNHLDCPLNASLHAN